MPPSGGAGTPTAAKLLLFPNKNYHKPLVVPRIMAKSDSFFIRAKVTSNGTTFAQSEIDLGSFVNLGVSKSTLLRIHGIQVGIRDETLTSPVQSATANAISYQLTTQSQSGIVGLDDKSVVASGIMTMYNAQIAEDGSASADFATGFASDVFDLNPSNYKNGYLIGVDNLYLGTDFSVAMTTGDVDVYVVMECTLETATQASATALALSQQ